jgi:hypothetical protein
MQTFPGTRKALLRRRNRFLESGRPRVVLPDGLVVTLEHRPRQATLTQIAAEADEHVPGARLRGEKGLGENRELRIGTKALRTVEPDPPVRVTSERIPGLGGLSQGSIA